MQGWNWVGMLALAVGLLGEAQPAAAQTLGPVLYDNGATQGIADAGPISDFSSPQTQLFGDSFTLTGNSQLDGVRWWGGYADSPFVDNFSIRIFAMSGGLPTAPLREVVVGSAVNRTVTGTIAGVVTQHKYEAQLPSVSLGAGTYMLSIVNNTGAAADWAWSGRRGSDGSFVTRDGGPWQTQGSVNLAFQLTGVPDDAPAVPEPSSALLFLPALGVMAFIKRRRSA